MTQIGAFTISLKKLQELGNVAPTRLQHIIENGELALAEFRYIGGHYKDGETYFRFRRFA